MIVKAVLLCDNKNRGELPTMLKKMIAKGKTVFLTLGLLSFLIHAPAPNYLLFTVLFAFMILFARDRRNQTSHVLLMLPFSSGILCFVMRLFYWDRIDFSRRVTHLLILSFLYSLYLANQRFNLIQKLLKWFNAKILKKRLLLIFCCSEILFIAASYLLNKGGVRLVGDEAHYLVISQSIAQDRDLDIFNQYFRDKYKEFFPYEELDHHGNFGKGYKTFYSIHLPGISFTLVPFFFLKIDPPLLYFLIRSYLGLFGSLLAVMIYLTALKLWKKENQALFISSAFTLTSPLFFFSIHIFPELQVVLFLVTSFYLILFAEKPGNLKILIAGLLLAMILFWGVKYALFTYLFGAGFFIYFLTRRSFKKALIFIIFPLFFQVLFWLYLDRAYGSLSPDSVYYGIRDDSQKQTQYQTLFQTITPRMRLETLLDYFFDQRDGLLAYNPLYFFAFPGILLALKKIKKYMFHLLLTLPAWAVILFQAFTTIRAGSCPQARYLVPAIWALLCFAVIYYLETRNQFFKKAIVFLSFYSFFVTLYQALNPFTLFLPTTQDVVFRPGLMFQQWSSQNVNLSAWLPSFIKIDNSSYLANYLFLALFLIAIILSLIRINPARGPLPSIISFIALFSIVALFPRPGIYNPTVVNNPQVIPHSIYYQNPYPSEKEEIKLTIRKEGHRSLIISTNRQIDFFICRFENDQASGRADVKIFNFDDLLDRLKIQPGAIQKSLLKAREYRKNKNLFYYQFHVKVEASDSTRPLFTFQIVPMKKGFTHGI